MIDVVALNRAAWDRESASGESEWSRPFDRAAIAKARAGAPDIVLTPTRSVPQAWFGALQGAQVLGLASGGGQQVPALAAAGARVTSFDNSSEQLARDREVADREALDIKLEQGDMMDLTRFEAASFDLVFNPVSIIFVPDAGAVWREVRRVLKPGGRLLTGLMNPALYMFDHEAIEAGAAPVVTHALPYDDRAHLDPADIQSRSAGHAALEFSHSLDVLIGDLLRSGFVLRDFYEDGWTDEATPLNQFMKVAFAMWAEAV